LVTKSHAPKSLTTTFFIANFASQQSVSHGRRWVAAIQITPSQCRKHPQDSHFYRYSIFTRDISAGNCWFSQVQARKACAHRTQCREMSALPIALFRARFSKEPSFDHHKLFYPQAFSANIAPNYPPILGFYFLLVCYRLSSVPLIVTDSVVTRLFDHIQQ
jgi:hypothetical protein